MAVLVVALPWIIIELLILTMIRAFVCIGKGLLVDVRLDVCFRMKLVTKREGYVCRRDGHCEENFMCSSKGG
jgi:hypothetical protein